jgi:hypothetical protein
MNIKYISFNLKIYKLIIEEWSNWKKTLKYESFSSILFLYLVMAIFTWDNEFNVCWRYYYFKTLSFIADARRLETIYTCYNSVGCYMLTANR